MRAVTGERRRDRGVALVEFAIVLPLLLLLIGGIVDFGRAFFTEVMLTNAAREGARTAMYAPPDLQDNVQNRAWAAAGSNTYTIAIQNACPTPGDTTKRVTVTVSDPNFRWILIKPAMALFGANLAEPNLTGKATMQCGG